jgi:hypothetical protein
MPRRPQASPPETTPPDEFLEWVRLFPRRISLVAPLSANRDDIDWNRSASWLVHYLLGRESCDSLAHLRRTHDHWPRIIDGVRPRDLLTRLDQPNGVTDAARHILLITHLLKVCGGYFTLRGRDLAPHFAEWLKDSPARDCFIRLFGEGPVDGSIWVDVAMLAVAGSHLSASLDRFVTETGEAIERIGERLAEEPHAGIAPSVGGISAPTMHQAVVRLGREMQVDTRTRLGDVSPLHAACSEQIGSVLDLMASLFAKWRDAWDVYARRGPGTADTDKALTELEREEAILQRDRPPPNAWDEWVSISQDESRTVIHKGESHELPPELFDAFLVLYQHRGKGWLSANKIADKMRPRYGGNANKLMQRLIKFKGVGHLIESRASSGGGYRLKDPPKKKF